jgi:hypothetical protein
LRLARGADAHLRLRNLQAMGLSQERTVAFSSLSF